MAVRSIARDTNDDVKPLYRAISEFIANNGTNEFNRQVRHYMILQRAVDRLNLKIQKDRAKVDRIMDVLNQRSGYYPYN